jgi:histidinol-phosphate aminotransferase
MSKAKYPSWLPINKRLTDATIYGAPQISNVIRLNTNENPFPLPKRVVKNILRELAKVLADLNRYPDRDALKLRAALAKYLSNENKENNALSLENIWAANGSNEILQTLFLTFGDRGALGFIPSYSMHELIANSVGVKWRAGKRNSDFTLDLESAIKEIEKYKPSLVFLTTPNNPTGTALTLPEIAKMAKSAKKVKALLIIDEAYEEFSAIDSALTLRDLYPNLVVVRTMSKAFALAGARLGYLAADRAIVEAVQTVRLPYHLSAPTQAIALAALAQSDRLLQEVDLLRAERDRVADQLERYGYSVVPSAANFILVTGFNREVAEMFDEILKRGILVRNIGIAQYLRVTIGTPEENKKFLAVMKELAQ